MANKGILKALLFTPGIKGAWGLPAVLRGHPGTAKSAYVERLNAEWGMDCEVKLGSIREAADFGGLLVPNADGVHVDRLAEAWVKRLAASGGTLFLDEINTAPPLVMAAMLRVLLDRVVGDESLGQRVRVMGAMNAVGEAAGGNDLPAALANRVGHFDWEGPGLDDWGQYILGGIDDAPSADDAVAEEERVLKAWGKPFAMARGAGVAFLRRRPELLHKQPAEGDPKASGAWPSRRSWEQAMRARAGAVVHGLSASDLETMTAAFVGTAAAAEWETYLTDADLPDPADVLDGKVEWKADERRLDRTDATLASCAAFVADKQTENRDARAIKLWEILGTVKAADVTVPAARTLVQAQLGLAKEARPVLARLQLLAQASGGKL